MGFYNERWSERRAKHQQQQQQQKPLKDEIFFEQKIDLVVQSEQPKDKITKSLLNKKIFCFISLIVLLWGTLLPF